MKTYEGIYDGPTTITEDLTVGRDAAVEVNGMFSTRLEWNQGGVAISGMVTTRPWNTPGRVLVTAGSMFTSDGAQVLQTDGSLYRLPPGSHQNVGSGGSDDYLVAQGGRWIPVT